MRMGHAQKGKGDSMSRFTKEQKQAAIDCMVLIADLMHIGASEQDQVRFSKIIKLMVEVLRDEMA